MKFIVRHYELIIVASLISWYVIWLVGVRIEELKIPKNKEIVTMPPAEIEQEVLADTLTDSIRLLTRRTDSYGIRNIDRSDTTGIMNLIATHFHQSTDTIDVEKYERYYARYYEVGSDFNEKTYSFHSIENPLYREAEEYNNFVCAISYNKGELQAIYWYPDGKIRQPKIKAKNADFLLSNAEYECFTPSIRRNFRTFKN